MRVGTSSKTFLILIAAAGSAVSQIHLSPGLTIGTPLSDTLISSSYGFSSGIDSSFNRFHSTTKRLLIGPTLRLDLPRGLSLEFDAIFQRVNDDYSSGSASAGSYMSQSFEQDTANRWQFPLLLQYSHTMKRVTPFVEAGPSMSTLTGNNGKSISTYLSPPSPATTTTSTFTSSAVTIAGITAGGGIAMPFVGHRLRAEVRFSHWLSNVGTPGFASVLERTGDFSVSFSPGIISGSASGYLVPASGGFGEHANEASFLLGLSF